MNETDFESLLADLFDDLSYDANHFTDSFPELHELEVETFADAHLATTNNGVVILLKDGSEFYLTIVKARRTP